ncbi:uncharacterized protein PHALS_06277 [Plasmopara halstedii]|uniref:Uncharacterized protein n=1 Tax=Plasmopara halstedii TaxID=4781 RepID=A0A0P1B2G6_PLAHL|nr:uncharacterized protein PHALS_06277 [Plasmopara halstedii]CEG48457.1 hypothetical protein PHALS_06277 [Plasmopara halstedii]|eukprot:XP_024584826.1 hypothetical protein PHALS_06277 [Plasmopara halstedii]
MSLSPLPLKHHTHYLHCDPCLTSPTLSVERRLCLTLTNFKRVNLGDVVRLSFAKGLCLDTKALHHA